jgi:carboxymethylenebutenolidase
MPDALEAEAKGLVPDARISRRRFAAGATVLAGYTLAAGPVAAQTAIATAAQGLDARDVGIPHKGQSIRGYWAAPEGGGPFPFVLVAQEIFGLHEYIKDVCRRLGKLGYAALVADHWYQAGDVSQAPSIEAIRPVVAQIMDAEVMAVFDSAVAFAAATGKADLSRMGMTGFCGGGRFVWLYAARNPQIKAGVAWYGHLAGAADALRPKHPIDLVDALRAPVLGLYGSADPAIPNATVIRMQMALKEAGRGSEIHLYPDAPHGFHADYRATYREAEAKDGWRRMLDWFKRHGAA